MNRDVRSHFRQGPSNGGYGEEKNRGLPAQALSSLVPATEREILARGACHDDNAASRGQAPREVLQRCAASRVALPEQVPHVAGNVSVGNSSSLPTSTGGPGASHGVGQVWFNFRVGGIHKLPSITPAEYLFNGKSGQASAVKEGEERERCTHPAHHGRWGLHPYPCVSPWAPAHAVTVGAKHLGEEPGVDEITGGCGAYLGGQVSLEGRARSRGAFPQVV